MIRLAAGPESRRAARRLVLFLATIFAACDTGVAKTTTDTPNTIDSSAIEAAALRQRNAELTESLRFARRLSERESLEKVLLVREVHGYDTFMEQLQKELRRIRNLEMQTGSLDPRRDPLVSMQSERARILNEARAARVRLARLEAQAEQEGRQLSTLRDSLSAAADHALDSAEAHDSSRVALASVRLLVHDLRGRIDELQHQVDSLTNVSRALGAENQRLSAAIAADAARDSTVYYVVGTRRQLLEWRLVREVGGVPVTGWGRVLQAAEIRDTTRFTASHMRNRVIMLDEDREYQLLSPQSSAALDTHVASDGTFRGSLRIKDPEAFWRGGRWLVVLAK